MSKLFAKHKAALRKKRNAAKLNEKVQSTETKNHVHDEHRNDKDPDEKNEPLVLPLAAENAAEGSETVELDIEGLSNEGRGLARHKGKAQFVSYALPGERVLAKVLTHKTRFDESQAYSIGNISSDRVEPQCSHYYECGGCSLQHLHPDAQIQHKQAVLMEHFQQTIGLRPREVLRPVTSSAYSYRSRTRLACDTRNKSDVRVGFRAKSSKSIINVDFCPVLADSIANIEEIRNLAQLFANESDKSILGHLEILDNLGHASIYLHLNKEMSKRLLSDVQAWSEKASVALHFSGPDAIETLEYPIHVIDSRDQQRQINLRYLASDFTQVNRAVNQKMIELTLSLLNLEKTDRVLDLFCGLGNFSLPMALMASEVTGVEGSADMVQRAEQNAQLNRIENAQFSVANLFEECGHQEWMQAQYDKIVLDPPRAGAKEFVKTIASLGAKTIVYISCNPATLARDSKEIIHQGYRLSKAGVLDMFPQTSHVESIAVFDRV